MADAKDLHLDVDFETARALHRVVRGMHDGECPRCHQLFDSRAMVSRLLDEPDTRCPNCGFAITHAEKQAAIRAFAPVMERNLAVFEEWRSRLTKV
jgi:predicted RNA-binding Zn-ribbon protein involved in translation (DUF1610 family)